MERYNNRDESEKGRNEVGLSNLDGQFNCFINSVLQALRTSTIFKNALLQRIEHDIDPGDKEYNFLIELNSLLRKMSTLESSSHPQIIQLSINPLRLELYKLFYQESKFELNKKSDCSSFLAELFKILHSHSIDRDLRKIKEYYG